MYSTRETQEDKQKKANSNKHTQTIVSTKRAYCMWMHYKRRLGISPINTSYLNQKDFLPRFLSEWIKSIQFMWQMRSFKSCQENKYPYEHMICIYTRYKGFNNVLFYSQSRSVRTSSGQKLQLSHSNHLLINLSLSNISSLQHLCLAQTCGFTHFTKGIIW